MSWAQTSTTAPTSTTSTITPTTALNVNVSMQGGKDPADYALAIGPALLGLCVAIFVVWLGARFTRKNMDRQWARENTERDRRWEEQRAHDRALFNLRERRTVYTNAIQAANRVVDAVGDARRARGWSSESIENRRVALRLLQTPEQALAADAASLEEQRTLLDRWDRSEEEYKRRFDALWRATEESRLIGTTEFSERLDKVLRFVGSSNVREATEDEYSAFMKQAYELIATATAQGMLDLGTLGSPTPESRT